MRLLKEEEEEIPEPVLLAEGSVRGIGSAASRDSQVGFTETVKDCSGSRSRIDYHDEKKL